VATSNIKRAVTNAIADYLATNIAGLQGRVSGVQEGPEKIAQFPSVALLGSSFVFYPSDPDYVSGDDDDPDHPLVTDIGEFDGLLELQLYADSKPMRELYEQRIINHFLAQKGSPGTIYVQLPTLVINELTTLYAPQVKVRLDNEEWNEELAFEAKRYSFLDLTFAFPALTAEDASVIDELHVAINHDLDSDVPMEDVIVNEDGSVS
jgi:hypothetical protein